MCVFYFYSFHIFQILVEYVRVQTFILENSGQEGCGCLKEHGSLW